MADGIGGIFEYLMARDDKDGIKRGGNSGLPRLSSRSLIDHRREKSRLRTLDGIPYRVPTIDCNMMSNVCL